MNKILIVDDQEENLYLLKTLLEGHGYQVLQARNGAEALEFARVEPPNMIISDILMPVMDGFSLCMEWKKDETLQNIPFIFYTATYTDPKDEELALNLGATRFLIKPVETEEFISILKQVIAEVETGVLSVPPTSLQEETTYYRMYNETLIRKLEDKMLQLEQANLALEKDIVQRKRAEEKVQRQLQKLKGLRSIDRAISGSFDMRIALDIVLQQVEMQLNADAGAILLFSPEVQTLGYIASRGFRFKPYLQLKLGERYAGQVVLERKTIHVLNLKTSDNPIETLSWAKENFVEYYGTPLVAKGEIKGVLEVFHRSALKSDLEWMQYLETLAGQAAIAIDNAQLFNSLQRSNNNLLMAYDATIEGWSRAMDLHDKETQDHTHRVLERTLRLAARMGLSRMEQLHLRRGVLLHDVGKLGVPEAILQKREKLTSEEWQIIQKHPTYAFELLSPIEYLRPALDIPYCHHEKWDGSGYPRGLHAEEIPLAARIFAVVDVWDALTSDRPYRPAWTQKQAREYIREQSGKHFDPKVVQEFINLLTNGEDLI